MFRRTLEENRWRANVTPCVTFNGLRSNVCRQKPTMLGLQISVGTKLFTAAPIVCGSSVWNLRPVILLAPANVMWVIDFWKICVPNLLYITKLLKVKYFTFVPQIAFLWFVSIPGQTATIFLYSRKRLVWGVPYGLKETKENRKYTCNEVHS